jgi:hypothetical protein
MKILLRAAAMLLPLLGSSFASAADFGRDEAPPPEAFIAPVPAVAFEHAYNDLYEDHGIYYAPPYPLPYFGLFPQWGPQIAFYPQPGWRGRPVPGPRRVHRRW